MPIMSRAAPEAAVGAVADELQALSRARGRGNFNAVVGDTGGSSAPVGAGLPIYGMPIAALDAAPDVALGKARQLGWRFLVADARGVKLVDLLDGVRRQKPTATVIKGALVERFGAAGLRAEADAPDRQFDARVLDFGRLGMSELWLHSEDGDDVFYSLSTQDPARRNAAEVIGEATERASRQPAASRKEKVDRDDDRGG